MRKRTFLSVWNAWPAPKTKAKSGRPSNLLSKFQYAENSGQLEHTHTLFILTEKCAPSQSGDSLRPSNIVEKPKKIQNLTAHQIEKNCPRVRILNFRYSRTGMFYSGRNMAGSRYDWMGPSAGSNRSGLGYYLLSSTFEKPLKASPYRSTGFLAPFSSSAKCD